MIPILAAPMIVPTACSTLLVLSLAPPPPPPDGAPPTAETSGARANAFAPPPAPAPPSPRPTCHYDPRRLSSRAVAPSLAVLHAGALARAPIDTRTLRGWQRRARAAAALPGVSLGWDHRRDRGYDLGQMAGAADDLSTDGGAGHTFRVRVDWALDRLVFNPDELRAARAALDWLDWRDRVLDRVTLLHAEWWSLVDTYRAVRHDGECPPEAVALERQMREVSGHLLSLTGRSID